MHITMLRIHDIYIVRIVCISRRYKPAHYDITKNKDKSSRESAYTDHRKQPRQLAFVLFCIIPYLSEKSKGLLKNYRKITIENYI